MTPGIPQHLAPPGDTFQNFQSLRLSLPNENVKEARHGGNICTPWVEVGDQEVKGSLGYPMRPCFQKERKEGRKGKGKGRERKGMGRRRGAGRGEGEEEEEEEEE